MSKKILLLVDFSYGGFGDVTNLIRIGRFLKSKGHKVYFTIAANHDESIQKFNLLYPDNLDLQGIICPTDKEAIKNSLLVMKRVIKKETGSGPLLTTTTYGYSPEVLTLLSNQSNISFSEANQRINKAIKLIDKQKNIKFDYQLALYKSRIKIKNSKIPQIVIDQYSSENGMTQSGSGVDYYIAPFVIKEEDENPLIASFHTHTNYCNYSKDQIIKYLLSNHKKLTFHKKHLLESKWGAYYSGSLGTNGLFFELLNRSLNKIKGKVTYFTFNDNYHFTKYILPCLNKNMLVIDLTNESPLVREGEKAILININTKTDIMESIINQSELPGACAGDGSFNIMFNRLRRSKNVPFFKFFNINQGYFFRFLVNKMHELELANNMYHKASRCFFAFGYYEKLFQDYFKDGSYEDELGITQFDILKLSKKNISKGLTKFFDRKKDIELMSRLFYDKKFQKRYCYILDNLVSFIRKEDKLLPIEDILLEILDK